MLTPGLTGPRSRSERLALQDARLRTNRSVAAVRAMWDGNLSGLSPGLREDWNSDWLQATPQQKEIVKRIFDTHRGAQPPPMAPRGADALRRILGSSSSWYGEQTSAGDHLGSPLPKGALCPLKVDEISVPSGVGSPIDPRLHSSTIAGYYEKAMELMVRSPTAVNHERLRGIVSYNDPNLAKGNTWLLVAEKMWRGNMLAFTDSRASDVALFTVVKKMVPSSDGTWTTSSRLVWDERRTNELFNRPPRLPLGSASSFSHWDLASQAVGEESAHASLTGDLPDWFYRVQLPEVLRPYFVFSEVSITDFIAHMAMQGVQIAPPVGARFLSLGVLPMGWNWAPFIAHTLMLDLVELALAPWQTRRVEDGLPVPQPLPGRPVHWGYMDDYGVLALLHRGADLERSTLGHMQEAIRGHLVGAGISPHKETLAWGLSPSLGVLIPADSQVLAIIEEKWWLLQEATEHVITLPAISGRALSRIVGMWTWRFTIFRELLSVFSSVYVFIADFDDDKPRALWESVRAELTALVALAPLARCDLGIPWSTTVLMTDASMEGFGVVDTTESVELIQHESRFSEKRGWMVKVDDEYSTIEHLEEEDRDPGIRSGALPRENIYDVTAFARPTRAVLHLYSGRRRALDYEHYIDALGQFEDWHLHVVSLDVQVDPVRGDLADPETVRFWQNQILSRRVVGLHAGPPCSTWSVARFNRANPGPRPVRSVERLWGIAGLTPSEKRAVDLGNTLLRASLDLIGSLQSVGGCFSLEHPADPGEAFPSIWKLPEIEAILRRGRASLVTLHQCRYGLNSVKPTMILSNFEDTAPLTLRCDHPRGTHVSLQGRDADGHWRTNIAMEYPPPLCEALARAMVETIIENNPDGFTLIDDDELNDGIAKDGKNGEVSGATKVRAPPPDLHWSREGRWRLTFKGTWDREEHINILEMRTLVAAARHLSRSKKNWHKKHLIFTDSAVCLGALGKGRSASPPLLRLCRRWSLFRIVLGMRIFLRHVPTDLNFADGPSRGLRVGEHEAQPDPRPKPRPMQAMAAAKEALQAYRGQG